MLLIFPIVYVILFLTSLAYVVRGKPEALLLFVVFGLPIYIVSLSVLTLYDLYDWVGRLQPLKEILVLVALVLVAFNLKERPRFGWVDALVFAYLGYHLAYVVLPVGDYGLGEKLIAYKNTSFFGVVYFTGRFLDPRKWLLGKYFHYMALLATLAASLVLVEVLNYTHFQTITGYAEYLQYFLDTPPAGNHGLSWTFEAENNGPKRFASFFANPLDHAAGTLVGLSAILALVTTRSKQLVVSRFLVLAFLATLTCIVFALSRASLGSYFLLIYVYCFLTQRKVWLQYINGAVLTGMVFAFFMLSGDLYDFLIGTLNFTNSSSAFHILQWLEGLNSLVQYPMGQGLGHSGRLSGMLGLNVGGENQLLIIGVQTGLIGMGLYVAIYVGIVRAAWQLATQAHGKARKLGMFVVLLKLGLVIPILTAEAESYLYAAYTAAFFSGLVINVYQARHGDWNRYQGLTVGPNRTANLVG